MKLKTDIGLIALIALAAACSDDGDKDKTNNDMDAGADAGNNGGGETDANGGGTKTDAGDAGMKSYSLCGGLDGDDLVDCGQYIVEHVAACVDCHTTPGTGDILAGSQGGPLFAIPGVGNIYARNLTPDKKTGLGDWTDDEIKNAFMNGESQDGSALVPVMPYYVLHNMADADADAIVAFLRSIPAVSNDVPDSDLQVQMPAKPVPVDVIPMPELTPSDNNYEAAMLGRYIAGEIGICMECHTEHVMGPVPINTDKLFEGGELFQLPIPGIPPEGVYSRNLTPDESGIRGWTAKQVRNALKDGVDDDGQPLCPPMPGGPMAAFGAMKEDHALAIGQFVTHLPPKKNPEGDAGAFRECVFMPPMGDGGM